MANRSYLYTISFDRTIRKRENLDKVVGLSEFEYAIPLSYKLMVSQNTKLSNSFVWEYEKPIAILGDFKKGKEKLINFLDELATKNLYDHNELKDRIEGTKDFLNASEKNLQFSMLECGEIFEMEYDPLEEKNKELFDSILQADKLIADFYEAVQTIEVQLKQLKAKMNDVTSKEFSTVLLESNRNEIENLEKEKWELLGIDYWCDALYYDFGTV